MVFCDGSVSSMEEILEVLEKFAAYSGGRAFELVLKKL